jgi:hypothetical protein
MNKKEKLKLPKQEASKSEITQNTVKIDSELLKKIKDLIKDRSKKIKYPTAKHFINIAVLEMLEKEEEKK